ncbi:proteasome subunit alpha type-3 [Histomonas meleagridis]|uniref:proteasome subunit alpha type-3 n=1 Tax=Histomonas meleagridis TaxID=135588 RepID=UPI00355A29B5|nr:proteasome subunit alpha type-3 [Histomonas meleagridis]KAH0797207.1 proteasome subunit alpha type-3 [Histomonas meleagridis]
MSGAGSGYDFNSFTFSPDGRLFQVEYATKAVDKETLAIGVRCSDGVLFAVEKNLASPLLAQRANPRIFWVDTKIACATVGYRPDCYAAILQARKEAATYFDNFGCQITVPELVSRVASTFHQSHAFASIRPFGCALLFGSLEGPSLYALEPNGQYFGYYAACFGKGSSLARAELQRTEWAAVTVEEAVPIVAGIIKGLHESQNKKWEIEMMWVCEKSGGKPEKVPDTIFVPEQ